MNAQQAENLRVLIQHMETSVTRTLNMIKYFNKSSDPECCTPACAMGEAAFCPALAHIGIPRGGAFLRTDYGHHFVDTRDNARLFDIGSGNAFKTDVVTPMEWAAEARKVLAENGYSMDVKPDAFPAFMAKVMEPVAVTA